MALHRGGELALALGSGLLVVLAGAQLGQQPGLLHGALEAAHRHLERLVFLDSYCRHLTLENAPKDGGKARIIYHGAMLILGIETSCDETGIALYDASGPGLLAHAVHSQVAMHEAYGGVVPELASRDHVRRLVPLARGVLRQAGRELADVQAVAYTQ